jgi:hypothetical protein
VRSHAKASSAGSSRGRAKGLSGIAVFGALLCLLVLAAPLAFAASAPDIEGTAASVGTEEVTLRGSVNPRGEETTYRFEWGATPSYGGSTASASIPAGEAPVAVVATVPDLTPGTPYYYRLVASNGTGTTPGDNETFTTLASVPSLGPERAYELVSQYPSGGVPVLPNNSLVSVSEDGERVHFGNGSQPLRGSKLVPPPDHLNNGFSYWRYGYMRSSDGWHMEEYGLADTLAGTPGFTGAGPSADGTKYMFTTISGSQDDPRFDPDDQNGGLVYNADLDLYLRKPDGTLVWISRDPRIPAGTPQTAVGTAGLFGPLGMAQMSVDGRTVVFRSQRPLDDADTTAPTEFGTPSRIYKWADGQLAFIGIRPDGSVPSKGSALSSGTEAALQGTVSRDGSRVLFSAQRNDVGEGRTLYIQTDGEPTVEAVKETGVSMLPANQPFEPTFRGASSDLSRAFYTTRSRLTPDSGTGAESSGEEDLYVYDIDADKVRDLTPRLDGISDSNVDPAEADRGRARGLVANSEDGKRIYFVADAQYDVAPSPEGELPSPEGRNLYLAELDGIDGPIELRFIAALGASDSDAWQAPMYFLNGKSSYASADGSVLGFGSTEPLTGQALGGTEQLFVYDAEADTLECASCPGDGSLPAGDVNLKQAIYGGQVWQYQNSYRRWVSTDGRVFFHTASQLVDGDTNFVDDVYEYRAGQLRLVSAGTGVNASRLEDVSRDGGTVIFTTGDTLIPQDEEPGIPKLYAARVGGGFPLVPKPGPCDLGAGACEAAGSATPQRLGAGSVAFEGAGDPKPKKAARRCPKGKRKVRRGGKVGCTPRKTRKHKRDAKHDRRASR